MAVEKVLTRNGNMYSFSVDPEYIRAIERDQKIVQWQTGEGETASVDAIACVFGVNNVFIYMEVPKDKLDARLLERHRADTAVLQYITSIPGRVDSTFSDML